MTKKPATNPSPEPDAPSAPSRMTLRDQTPDRDLMGATTMDLLWRLIGEGAANEYAVHHSLWRLLAERRGLGIPWFENERLDLLAELLQRFAHQPPRPAAAGIDGPEAAAALFRHIALLDHEELWMACLNTKNIPLAVVRVGIGGATSVVAFPSHVYRKALAWNASEGRVYSFARKGEVRLP